MSYSRENNNNDPEDFLTNGDILKTIDENFEEITLSPPEATFIADFEEPENLQGQIIGNHYQIIDNLGSGGFAKTYVAEDLEIPEHPFCVVKQLQPQFSDLDLLENAKQRFATEANVLQRLGNHPQIPSLLAHFTENEQFYLIQEFIAGEDLTQAVQRQLFTEIETINLLEQVLKILCFVHQQGVIHRDIKLSNLMRRLEDGKIFLIDFGAVKEIPTLFIDQQHTIYTQVIGTPGYMPLEQTQGKPIYSSDLYALGVTAIYALTGKPLAKVIPHCNTKQQPDNLNSVSELAHLSPLLTAILGKMVAYESSHRYQSAQEVLEDLAPLTKLGITIGGRYRLLEYLGGGIASYTYLAENLWRPYQSPCVIKQLQVEDKSSLALREAEQRFAQELAILAKLGDHPQIPQLWDHFEANGTFYLVQEYIQGEELSETLAQNSPLTEEQVGEILHDVLQILDFIHQQGVIHRDIKPSNLIRRQTDGKIVLIDFGIVKEIVSLSSQEKLSSSSTQSVGTEGYMPPEQMAGRPTFSSDIYALGMTAIQALTGVHPRDFPSDLQTGELILSDLLDTSLVQVLTRMVRLDVSKRYHKAKDVLRALKFKGRKQRQWLPQLEVSSSMVWCLYGGGLLFLVMMIIFGQHFYRQYQAIVILAQGDAQLAVGNYGQAVEIYDQGLEIEPKFERAWLQKALALSHLGEFSAMLQACQSAIELNVDSVYAWNCRGLALDNLARYPEAIATYNRALNLDVNSFDVWNNRGEAYLKSGRLQRAIEDFQKAIELDSDGNSYIAWHNLGKSYYQLQKLDQALSAYQQAIQVKLDYVPAIIGMGNVYKSQGKFSQALQAYGQALKFNPQSYEAWYVKGTTHEALKDISPAINSYEQALKIKPDYQAAQEGLRRLNR